MTSKNVTIYEALCNVQGKINNVTRDTGGQVGNTKYKYATLDAVYEELRPLLLENGLSVLTVFDGDMMGMRLIHTSGEIMECGWYPLGSTTKHQERGSALTYARRYMLTAIFGIAQEDDDGAKGNDTLGKKLDSKPTNGERSAQQEYGSAATFKKAFVEVQEQIRNMDSIEDKFQIELRIAKCRKVDAQSADQLMQELEAKVAELVA